MRRIDPLLTKRVSRAGAFVLLGAVIFISAIQFHREKPMPLLPPSSTSPMAAAADKTNEALDATLERCRAIVRPEDVDDACRAAWAEVRCRFFAPDETNEAQDAKGVADTNEVRP